MRDRLLKLSLWQAEAGKPFVADLIGNLGVLFIFGSVVSLLCAFIFFDKNNRSEE
ncbi:MAG: hypothetical protein IJX58_05435 [Clostridia bacterium]|nr:hypothetical protein [Clostridia bacterium]